MDESIFRNLDTQHRLLASIEGILDADIDNETGGSPHLDVPFARSMTYSDLTAANDQVRDQQGWEDVDLFSALTPLQQSRYAAWRDSRRLPWTREDFMALGFAGAIGAAATLFDTQLDEKVSEILGKLKDTDLLKGWENDARRLPIDYTGPGVGGPSHRVKSPGHDLGRPLEALRQIREGVFRGTAWPHGVRTPVIESLPSWQSVESWPAAMILWAKHLAADIVTPMSLPLPGFTKLLEFDSNSLRGFAHAAYQGPRPLGQGLNIRSGLLTPALSMLSTEAIVRTHMLTRSYRARGTLDLTSSEQALQTELLLAGHGLVGAVALGKTTAALMFGETAFAVRYLNVPVLMRVATLGLSAVQTQRQRSAAAAPTWDDVLMEWAQPWQLEAALDVEQEAVVLAAPVGE